MSPAASHFHSLQVENCDSNSRFVVDEDDNGKLRLERVNIAIEVANLGVLTLSVRGSILDVII